MPTETLGSTYSALHWRALPALIMITAITGVWLGGGGVWLGILQLPVMALVDTLLGPDHRPSRPIPVWAADGLLCLQLPLMAILWIAFTIRIGPGAELLQGFDWLGVILATAFATAYGAVPASHELNHRDDYFRHKVGNLIDTFLLAPYGELSHNHVHHLRLDTGVDSETAYRGQNAYQFMIYMGWNRHLESWRIEADRLRKLGYSAWSWRSAVWRGFAQYALILAVVGSIAGWAAVGLALLVSVLALLMLTVLSYSQHYGLTRVPDSPILDHHAWNHLYPLTRGGMFEIATHSKHHGDAAITYWQLAPVADAPQQPSSWLCFMVALIPPLWVRMMQPRLRQWDLHHANSAEKALARQANQAAGWPDWFEDNPA